MSKNMPQGNPISPQPGRRDTERREQRNMDGGYDQKRSDGQAQAPKPEDPKRPATKPQGTTEDQITNMESEGQAQDAVDPQEPQQERPRKR
jgi:hypothetical protein